MTKYLLVFLVACTVGEGVDPTTPTTTDPWPVLDRAEREGPPRYASRVHSCAKLRYRTLGNLLVSRGVNLAATDPVSAGKIYTDNAAGLGAPSYLQRVRENVEIGLATESKIFDIFVQAAPEIIAAMPTQTACMVAGAATMMFDASGKCTANGIACLQGMKATQDQVDLCNIALTEGSTPQIGQAIAVATILAAANTCE
jgi:hypothetical protein